MKSTNDQYVTANLTPAGDGNLADIKTGAIYVGLSVPAARDNATENNNQNETGVGVAVSGVNATAVKLLEIMAESNSIGFIEALKKIFPDGKINLVDNPELAPLARKYCVPEAYIDKGLIDFGSLLEIEETWIGALHGAVASPSDKITIPSEDGATLELTPTDNRYQAKLFYTPAGPLAERSELGDAWNHDLGGIIDMFLSEKELITTKQNDGHIWVIPEPEHEISEAQLWPALADPQRVTNKSP
jgi:hypothetical protein